MSSTLRFARKVPAILGAAGLLVLAAAGPADADSGSGTVTGGYEIPSEKVTLASGPQCAKFHKVNDQSNPDPTIHTLPMSGDFGADANTGTGTATFSITDDWFAGPSGTFSNLQCNSASGHAGTWTISFTGWSCSSGTATYTRSSTTTYSLTGTASCDDLSTTGTVETISTSVTFSGSQDLCGNTGQPTCNNANAGTNLAGSYTWSN